jgi:serine/threonine protein phosphatase PrpC
MQLATGQASAAGVKAVNEDSMGLFVPDGAMLTHKGAAAVIADGVSAAEAGREAAEICVKTFLDDYFATPDSWSVETSAQRVLTAINRWLYGRGSALPDSRRGYVSTLSALVLKSHTGHLFHVGDSRIQRLRAGKLEQLTRDHSTPVDEQQTYLTRAMGMDVKLDVDYQRVDLERGDVFLLTTDGLHGYVPSERLAAEIGQLGSDGALQACCERLLALALAAGSPDNVTCQLVRIDALPAPDAEQVMVRVDRLPVPPPLSVGMKLDGYEVLAVLHESKRSHVYLVRDPSVAKPMVMKAPSPNFEDDPEYLERFGMEHWIASRVPSLHVVRAIEPLRPRAFLYNLMEYIDGVTLEQWIEHHPKPDVHEVVQVVRQVGRGLTALHRRETLHQDIKPANVMLAADGTAKLIDLGSCRVAGILEIASSLAREEALGTLQYSAPEYRIGMTADRRSDTFSLGCVCYEMLTGQLPYGEAFERARTREHFAKLRYRSASTTNPLVPAWLDGALERAVQLDPARRYPELSEWLHDLEHPNPSFEHKATFELDERSVVRRWQAVSAVLAAALLLALWALLGR